MSTKPEKTQKTPTAKALPITTSCANDPATETPNPAVRKTPLDIKMLAGLAKMTHSLSPMSLSLAGIDWAGHLAFAPGKRLELFSLGLEQMQQLWQNALPRPRCTASAGRQARSPFCRSSLAAVAIQRDQPSLLEYRNVVEIGHSEPARCL